MPAYASAPAIASVSSPVLVGGAFSINGSGFSAGAKVNFFVSTASGSINQGPFTPATITPTYLKVNVPATVPMGQGVVALQVVNTDQHFASSGVVTAQLAGAAGAGIPTINAINLVSLAATSTNPAYAIDNVETVVPRGGTVVLQGSGFDTVNGVAVDVFCAAAGGKVGPFFINPGDPGLSATSVSLTLPASGPYAPPVGPASFVISNRGSDGSYASKSNAVSAPIGSRIHVMAVAQSGGELIVDGTGFSTLTVINLFNAHSGGAVNLGGLAMTGAPAIPITLVSDTEIRFAIPAGAVAGPAYVQAINPPFVPYTSSGNDPGGAIILTNPSAVPSPPATPTPGPTPTPIGAGPTPIATPTPKSSASPVATPTATPGAAYGMLAAGGMDNTLTASGDPLTIGSAETYDEADGVFEVTGSMAYPRLGHSATVLNNHKILVAGGHDAYSVRAMASAELYDIASGTFSFTGTMNSARLGHAAVLLNNGKVLVAGGQNADFAAINLAEIYDPATGVFTPTASMLAARINPASVVLNDGTVLIAGGADDSGALASAELYDVNGAGSVAVGSMTTARQGATATLLANGEVLVAGGVNAAGTGIASAELYNPATKTFTATGSMSVARRGHSATLLANGTVLIAGGFNDGNGTALNSAELYNPATGRFTPVANMNSAHFGHSAATLESGKVLVAGGFDRAGHATNQAEIYDPATGKFTLTGSMIDARADYAMGCYEASGTAAMVSAKAAHATYRVALSH